MEKLLKLNEELIRLVGFGLDVQDFGELNKEDFEYCALLIEALIQDIKKGKSFDMTFCDLILEAPNLKFIKDHSH